MGKLYLRDLTRGLRQSIASDIVANRPRLKMAMINGKDIIIGSVRIWDVKKFKKA